MDWDGSGPVVPECFCPSNPEQINSVSGTLAGIKSSPARLVALVHIFLVPFGLSLKKIILLKIHTDTGDNGPVTSVVDLDPHHTLQVVLDPDSTRPTK
jgi:hypothetical protein